MQVWVFDAGSGNRISLNASTWGPGQVMALLLLSCQLCDVASYIHQCNPYYLDGFLSPMYLSLVALYDHFRTPAQRDVEGGERYALSQSHSIPVDRTSLQLDEGSLRRPVKARVKENLLQSE
jgi:hypothetical protein